MTGIPLLLKEWNAAWITHHSQLNTRGASWTSWRLREPFELVGASMIYTYNAIRLVPKSLLHKSVRQSISNSQSLWELLANKRPNFHINTSKKVPALYSTMHIASSSFRLSAALYLIEREMLDKAGGGLLKDMLNLKKGDWKPRSVFEPYRKRAMELQCCKIRKPLSLFMQGDAVELALAIIIHHRDEFGHGEKGRPARHDLFDNLHLFRILEAQVVLANYGVKVLARID